MFILVTTQITENYGTVEQPFWKPKGGDQIQVPISLEDAQEGSDRMEEFVDAAAARLINNDMFKEEVLTWELMDFKLEVGE